MDVPETDFAPQEQEITRVLCTLFVFQLKKWVTATQLSPLAGHQSIIDRLAISGVPFSSPTNEPRRTVYLTSLISNMPHAPPSNQTDFTSLANGLGLQVVPLTPSLMRFLNGISARIAAERERERRILQAQVRALQTSMQNQVAALKTQQQEAEQKLAQAYRHIGYLEACLQAKDEAPPEDREIIINLDVNGLIATQGVQDNTHFFMERWLGLFDEIGLMDNLPNHGAVWTPAHVDEVIAHCTDRVRVYKTLAAINMSDTVPNLLLDAE